MHVRRLRLKNAGVDILRIGELEVVKLTMLGAGTVHPYRALRLNKDAATVVDVDLIVVGEVELVVSDPEPVVLKVDSCFGGDVQE